METGASHGGGRLCQAAPIALLHYVTHPQVTIDPDAPVTSWHLSPEGLRRARALLDQPWVRDVGRIVSSHETKAQETAAILADHLGLEVEVRADIGENDRSATGFVPPPAFEQLADRFFADPEESVEGWERAADAQARIVAGLADLLDPGADRDLVVVGHGGIGTLWYCALAGVAISRDHDQPGQGHHLAVDLATGRPLHGWRPIDRLPS